MFSVKVIAVIGAVSQMLSCTPKQAMQTSVYSEVMQIVNVDIRHDTVDMETSTGNVYRMYGVEDWAVGDLAGVLMDDAGTPKDITDDLIISAKYSAFNAE